MPIQEFSRTILLTGAGFTHNFDTPLAEGMWAQLFSNPKIQKRKKIRTLMLDQAFFGNYEYVYDDVLNKSEFDEEDKKAIQDAMLEVYTDLDKTITKTSSNLNVNIEELNKLLRFFSMDRGKTCCFFTLNQDLFIERHYTRGEGHPHCFTRD